MQFPGVTWYSDVSRQWREGVFPGQLVLLLPGWPIQLNVVTIGWFPDIGWWLKYSIDWTYNGIICGKYYWWYCYWWLIFDIIIYLVMTIDEVTNASIIDWLQWPFVDNLTIERTVLTLTHWNDMKLSLTDWLRTVIDYLLASEAVVVPIDWYSTGVTLQWPTMTVPASSDRYWPAWPDDDIDHGYNYLTKWPLLWYLLWQLPVRMILC